MTALLPQPLTGAFDLAPPSLGAGSFFIQATCHAAIFLHADGKSWHDLIPFGRRWQVMA